ncbi:MAG: pilin [bacterium]|nr:pilin [bacterium]
MRTVNSKQYIVNSWGVRFFIFVFSLFTIYYLLSTTIPTPVQGATDYTLLAPIPLGGADSTPAPQTTAKPYIEGVFKLIIGLAGGLAVVMIILGGIQYMSTDAFTGKSEARNTIQNAIWGLLLVIGAWLILYTINPKLVEFDLSIAPQEIKSAITGGTSVPSAGCPTCVAISVPHKTMAQNGCGSGAVGGACTIDKTLNDKLVDLQGKYGTFTVNESYPPSTVVSHQDPCHGNGTCVDASIPFSTPQNVKSFIDNASSAGLTATFEAKDAATASQIRSATGLSATQVTVTKGNGEHFHIK